MLLGVSELPCQGKTDLAQWHFYGHVLYVIRTHGLLLDVELVVGRSEEHQTQVKLILHDRFGEGGIEECHTALIALQIMLLGLDDATHGPLQFPRQGLGGMEK